MKIRYSVKTAFHGLKASKSRSLLTILGIVIGITGIMLIVSIGSGAEKLILTEIGGLGADTIVIRPGQEPTGPSDIAQTLFSDSIKKRDLVALSKKSNVPDLETMAPVVFVSGGASFGGETYSPTIFGWSAEFMGNTLNIYPEQGEYFGDAEISDRASVAVIGAKVKEELFGDVDPLGKYITIKNHKFRVMAVLPKKGQLLFFNVDEVVIIPYTTAQTYITGTDYYQEILAKARSADVVDIAVVDITRTLRELHNISDPSKDDFYVETQQGLATQVQTIIQVLTIFLTSVVAISLVVGGIGVMNIMLVSVSERVKEIGLRKAVGATKSDISKQFLLEAIMLTGAGGAIGIFLGTMLSLLSAVVLAKGLNLNWNFSFPLVGALLGFGVSLLVGVVFGLYPAKKAAEKTAIEALRYE